jgi:hypothetical protein
VDVMSQRDLSEVSRTLMDNIPERIFAAGICLQGTQYFHCSSIIVVIRSWFSSCTTGSMFCSDV